MNLNSGGPYYYNVPTKPFIPPSAQRDTLHRLREAAYTGLKRTNLAHYAGVTTRELAELEAFDSRVGAAIAEGRAQAEIDMCRELWKDAVENRNPKTALEVLRHRYGWKKAVRARIQPTVKISIKRGQGAGGQD